MDYCVGFMREALSNRVLLVRKTKPAWQTGLLNGVGGKVDHFMESLDTGKMRPETPLEAMVREFQEETGIETEPREWRHVLYMTDARDHWAPDGGTVHWFACTRRFLPEFPDRVLNSNEPLLAVNLYEILARPDVVATLRWVLPMAFLDETLAPIGSDDHVRARSTMAVKYCETVDDLVEALDMVRVTYNGFGVGDWVKNSSHSECGHILAFDDDGKVAWVQSAKYQNKFVTLYVSDLLHHAEPVLETLKPQPKPAIPFPYVESPFVTYWPDEPGWDKILTGGKSKLERGEVCTPVAPLTNKWGAVGASSPPDNNPSRGCNGPPGPFQTGPTGASGCTGPTGPLNAPCFDGRPIKLEPLERPDAPWIGFGVPPGCAGQDDDQNGAGAQERFGDVRPLTRQTAPL